MSDQSSQSVQNASPQDATAPELTRIGCVSYLNAKPLIHGVDQADWADVRYGVPSALLGQLEQGDVDIALCPVIDLQRSDLPLAVLPVGGIGCMGPTLTVRLFSQHPASAIKRVAVDLDSHTSVALLRVLLQGLHGLQPTLVPFEANGALPADVDAVLLIGDKVVTGRTPAHDWPHQVDLGEAWHDWTGLPFLFAVWMCRADADLTRAAERLNRARLTNQSQIAAIAQQYAPRHHWPIELARHYLGHMLRYQVAEMELAAIQSFFVKAADTGIIDANRPIQIANGRRSNQNQERI